MTLDVIKDIFGGIFIDIISGGVVIFRWGAGGRWDSGFAGSGSPPPTPLPQGGYLYFERVRKIFSTQENRISRDLSHCELKRFLTRLKPNLNRESPHFRI